MLSVSVCLTLGFLLLILILLFIRIWNVYKMIRGFPIYHTLGAILRYHMARKKETIFTNFLFQMITDVCKKHAKDGFCMAYDPFPLFYVFSEEPIKLFLNDKAAMYKTPHYKMLADGIGNGLATSSGERWKKHRKLLRPVFQLGMLKEKIPIFNEHALALIEELKTLKDKPSSSCLSLIKQHYFNAFSESIFGMKQNEGNKAEVMKYFHGIDNIAEVAISRAHQPWLWWTFALKFSSSGRKCLKIYSEVYNFTENVILEMKEYIVSNKEFHETGYFSKNFHKSFAYVLLQQHLKDPSFTFKDLHDEVNTIMSAGFDTVSYTTMWCLFMLGLYPDIQEKAFQEVQSTYHDYVTYEEMNNFTYLEAVIMETLRLYPTIPMYGRKLTEDIQLGEKKVLKGTSVIILPYFWHRDPINFPDPEKFDPGRFLKTNGRKPWQHIPFAEGNRVCLGKQYSLLEMKVFLAHILRHFKITSLDRREDIKLCLNLVLTPAKPLRMLFKSR